MAKKWEEKVVNFLFLGFGNGQRQRKKGYKKKLWDSTVAKRKEKEIAFFLSWALAMVNLECAKKS